MESTNNQFCYYQHVQGRSLGIMYKYLFIPCSDITDMRLMLIRDRPCEFGEYITENDVWIKPVTFLSNVTDSCLIVDRGRSWENRGQVNHLNKQKSVDFNYVCLFKFDYINVNKNIILGILGKIASVYNFLYINEENTGSPYCLGKTFLHIYIFFIYESDLNKNGSTYNLSTLMQTKHMIKM